MARTGSVNHTHQYFRRADRLWGCSGIDNCTHYMPKNMSPAPVGLFSRCWQCEKEFQLTPINMENDKPLCDACSDEQANIARWLATKDIKPVTGLAAFGAKKPIKRHESVKPPVEEKDEIEVIEEDETHAGDCEVYNGGECTCK